MNLYLSGPHMISAFVIPRISGAAAPKHTKKPINTLPYPLKLKMLVHSSISVQSDTRLRLID